MDTQGKIRVDVGKAISQFNQIIKEFKLRKTIYKTVFRGKGLEFDGYRYYDENLDDATILDWKASIRAGRLLAKKYIEERDLNVYFIFDSSNKMLFGSGDKLKAEYASEVVAALSYLIINSEDMPGLIMFSDKMTNLVRPAKSRSQFPLLVKSLSNIDFYGGNFDFAAALEEASKKIKSAYSVIFLVSDFINIKKGFEKSLNILSTRFETVAIMIRDRFDDSLPDAHYQISIQDPESGRQILVDPASIKNRYQQLALKQKNAVKEMFKHSGVDLIELHTYEPFVVPLASFLKSRAERGRK
ncbi:MAG: DUF58 domain-containing protein [Nanoarchaeota archaeon]|nr:DUF58 domain-containing protein [Nanoarchaeota archaeon]